MGRPSYRRIIEKSGNRLRVLPIVGVINSVFVVQVLRVRDMMSLKFSEKVYEGFWFSPEMEYLQNAMDFCQRWAVVPRTEHFVDDT